MAGGDSLALYIAAFEDGHCNGHTPFRFFR
jgi:hypothetical protein